MSGPLLGCIDPSDSKSHHHTRFLLWAQFSCRWLTFREGGELLTSQLRLQVTAVCDDLADGDKGFGGGGGLFSLVCIRERCWRQIYVEPCIQSQCEPSLGLRRKHLGELVSLWGWAGHGQILTIAGVQEMNKGWEVPTERGSAPSSKNWGIWSLGFKAKQVLLKVKLARQIGSHGEPYKPKSKGPFDCISKGTYGVWEKQGRRMWVLKQHGPSLHSSWILSTFKEPSSYK